MEKKEKKNKVPFFKRKVLYIILTIIFSLVLVLDLAVAICVPTQDKSVAFDRENMEMPEGMEVPEGFSQGGMGTPGGMEFPDDMEMPEGMEIPEGFEPGDMELPDDMEMPEGMEVPEGFSPGGMGTPGGMEFPDDMEMPEGMEVPEGFSPGGMGASGSMGNSGDMNFPTEKEAELTFLQKVKEVWVYIFVIALLLDIASITMLIILSRKEKEEEQQGEAEATDGEVHLTVKKKKKDKHPYLMGIILLIGAIFLVVFVKLLVSQSKLTQSRTEANIYIENAKLGSISTIIPGTGTLVEDEGEALELAEGIEITEWYVENGDTVSKGDVIAKVDKTTVMSSIVEAEELIEALDEEIEEHEEDQLSDTIDASVDGRVKVIYAEEGKTVDEVMYDKDALMLISLDGMMAVELDTELKLSAGDVVSVILSDNTEVSGKVQSVLGKGVVVTISDELVDYGETITVYTEDGSLIGTEEAYIHSELKLTGYAGTIEAVEVSVDDEVSEGESLISITDTDYTAEYELLLQQRTKLVNELQEMFVIYNEGYIYADVAGVITGMDDSIEKLDTTGSDGDGLISKANKAVNMLTSAGEQVAPETTETPEAGGESGGMPTPETGGNMGGEANSQGNAVVPETGNTGATGQAGNPSGNAGAQGTTNPVGAGNASGVTGAGGMNGMSGFGGSGMSGFGGSGMTGFGGSGMTGGTDTGATQTESEEASSRADEIKSTYQIATTSWLNVVPQDNMEITITIDEMDILSIQEGQSAVVTLDAFPGQSFDGVVKSVNLTGTNSGGSTKYEAVIQIDRLENMLAGMNASVKITVDTKENVLVISENALIETEAGVYVYTGYNQDEDSLKDMVQVTTGLSDGENVEILAGLEAGDQYCYSYLDTVNYSTYTESSQGGFGMQSLFGEPGRR